MLLEKSARAATNSGSASNDRLCTVPVGGEDEQAARELALKAILMSKAARNSIESIVGETPRVASTPRVSHQGRWQPEWSFLAACKLGLEVHEGGGGDLQRRSGSDWRRTWQRDRGLRARAHSRRALLDAKH